MRLQEQQHGHVLQQNVKVRVPFMGIIVARLIFVVGNAGAVTLICMSYVALDPTFRTSRRAFLLILLCSKMFIIN